MLNTCLTTTGSVFVLARCLLLLKVKMMKLKTGKDVKMKTPIENTPEVTAARMMAEALNITDGNYAVYVGKSCKMFGLDYQRAEEYARLYKGGAVVDMR